MKRMASGDKLRLVDVREVEEFNASHLEESESMPVTCFQKHYQEILQDKDEEIILVCRSGGRSMIIAIFLEGQGYKNLVNFDGGVLGWAESGLKLTPTQEILPSHLKAMPDLF